MAKACDGRVYCRGVGQRKNGSRPGAVPARGQLASQPARSVCLQGRKYCRGVHQRKYNSKKAIIKNACDGPQICLSLLANLPLGVTSLGFADGRWRRVDESRIKDRHRLPVGGPEQLGWLLMARVDQLERSPHWTKGGSSWLW